MDFEYQLNVRGYELDAFGHVNNAVYLNYLEEARWQILSKTNLFHYLTQNKLILVVIENHIRYINEAKQFDRLLIKSSFKKEAPYLTFYQAIYQADKQQKIVKARVKTLFVNDEKIAYDVPENITLIEHGG